MEDTEEKDEYGLFTITSTKSRNPILATVEVDGKSLTIWRLTLELRSW